jgi:hypothetical protein
VERVSELGATSAITGKSVTANIAPSSLTFHLDDGGDKFVWNVHFYDSHAQSHPGRRHSARVTKFISAASQFLLASPHAPKVRMCGLHIVYVWVLFLSHARVLVSLQAGRTVQEEPLPTLSYYVIWLLGLALVALIVLVTVCLWKRKEMSKCVTRSSKSRQSSSGSVSTQRSLFLSVAVLDIFSCADEIENPKYDGERH